VDPSSGVFKVTYDINLLYSGSFHRHATLGEFIFGKRHAAQYDCRPNTDPGYGDPVSGVGSNRCAGHCLLFDLYPIFFLPLEMRLYFFFGPGRTSFRRYP
jgi:hypothetical protein